MVWLSYWCDWRLALHIVTPETFTRWHRQGFRLFWQWQAKSGRPALPKDLRALIRRIALENPTGRGFPASGMAAGSALEPTASAITPLSVRSRPILSGLHHEYGLQEKAE